MAGTDAPLPLLKTGSALMSLELARPIWPIERTLSSLIGENVRIGARAFAPRKWNGEAGEFIPVSRLVLPDNSEPPSSFPVFFEGKLKAFSRRAAVIYAELDSPFLD